MSKNYIEKRKHSLSSYLEVDGVYTIFCNVLRPQYTTRGESHSFWEFVYVSSGVLYADTMGKLIDLKAGEFIIHCPYDFHRHFTLDGMADISIFTFDCDCELLYSISRRAISIDSSSVKFIKSVLKISGGIFEKYDASFDFIKYDDYNYLDEQLLKNTIEILLITLINQEEKRVYYFENLDGIKNRSDDMVRMVIEFMGENLYEKIRIEDICRKFNICKTALSVKFKEETAMTVMDYYNNIKIMKSIDCLMNNDMNISQVAERFNYSSSQYYCKVFKKYIGLSPKQYIRKNKNRRRIIKIDG